MKRYLFLPLFFILIFFLALPVFSGDRIDLTKKQLELLSALQSQGVVSIEPNLNRVLIDPGLWYNMKYSIKKDFAASLAVYCGNQKGTQLYWVEIYDMYSGKRLAKFSRSLGFKVY